MPRKINLVGAHSTGKTTLAQQIAKTYQIPHLTGSARGLLKSMGLTLEQLRLDLEQNDNFQMKVFLHIVSQEKNYPCFVSDRAFDYLAYTAENSRNLSEIMGTPEFHEYMEQLRLPERLLFFIRPREDMLVADGVRSNLNWGNVNRIDGMIQFILESFNLPYISINSSSMRERVRTIDSVLQWVQGAEAVAKATKLQCQECPPSS